MQLAQILEIVDETITTQAFAPGAPELRMFVGEPGTRRVPLLEYLERLAALESYLPDRSALAGLFRQAYYPNRCRELLSLPPPPRDPVTFWTTTPSPARDAFEWLWHVGSVTLPRAGRLHAVQIKFFWAALDCRLAWPSLEPVLSGHGLSLVGLLTWQGALLDVLSQWLVRRSRNATTPDAETPENVPADSDQWLRRAIAERVPREDLIGAIDALLLSEWARSAPDLPPSQLLSGYYLSTITPPRPGQPGAGRRLDLLIVTDPFMRGLRTAQTEASLRAALSWERLLTWRQSRLGYPLDWFLMYFAFQAPDASGTVRPRPWFARAAEALASRMVAVLMHEFTDQWEIPNWPGSPDPLYGSWDLMEGDNDDTKTYGGQARASDPGGHVARLVADLCNTEASTPVGLGFDGARSDPDTLFGPHLNLLVREFQIEASQRWVLGVPGGGWHVRQSAYRRYRGRITGRVDWETRQALQLWLNRAGFDTPNPTDPSPELSARCRFSNIVNGLRVFDARPRDYAQERQGNHWWWNDRPAPTWPDGSPRDSDDPRFYAADELQRIAIPSEERLPSAAPVAFRSLTVSALGGWPRNRIGPWLLPNAGTWNSTRFSIRNLEQLAGNFPPRGDPARTSAEATFAAIYAATAIETGAFMDVYNAWDTSWMSLGLFHWTYRLADNPTQRGEMAGLLGWYKERDPDNFTLDFTSWGVDVDAFNLLPSGGYGIKLGHLKTWGLTPAVSSASTAITATVNIHLRHWLRSWRSIFRLVGILRTSRGFLRAQWQCARWRIREVLNAPWSNANNNLDIVRTGGNPATLGDIFTSEASLAALMRFHVNRPGLVFPLNTEPNVNNNGAPGRRVVEWAIRSALGTLRIATPINGVALAANANFHVELIHQMAIWFFIVFNAQPAPGSTLTFTQDPPPSVGNPPPPPAQMMWTFVAGAATPNQTNIGLTLADTLTALAADLNASNNVLIRRGSYTANPVLNRLEIVLDRPAFVLAAGMGANGTAFTIRDAATVNAQGAINERIPELNRTPSRNPGSFTLWTDGL